MRHAAGAVAAAFLLPPLAYWYWRRVWFFRNPPRTVPPGESIVSPADGRVVYVKRVPGDVPVISIKRGLAASVNDIVRDDLPREKVLIGVFMSPFDVHYNRAPISGEINFIHHYPPLGKNRSMFAMHLRIICGCPPFHRRGWHIIANERTVTRIEGTLRGSPLACYVVQIAARCVSGIESYVQRGQFIEKGAVFGMIRIGSQVDLVVPWREGMRIQVKPGNSVRAGETVMID